MSYPLICITGFFIVLGYFKITPYLCQAIAQLLRLCMKSYLSKIVCLAKIQIYCNVENINHPII